MTKFDRLRYSEKTPYVELDLNRYSNALNADRKQSVTARDALIDPNLTA